MFQHRMRMRMRTSERENDNTRKLDTNEYVILAFRCHNYCLENGANIKISFTLMNSILTIDRSSILLFMLSLSHSN